MIDNSSNHWSKLGKILNLAKRIVRQNRSVHYIRIGILAVKTPHGTPLRFITSSVTINQQWLTLDHSALPLNNSPKDSGGFKKTTCKKTEWNYKKNFMGPFYGWGSTASRLEPLWKGILLNNTKSPEIPGTHFINLGRMKDRVDLGATQWFWPWDSWIGNSAP